MENKIIYQDYQKMKLVVKGWLQGRGYYNALKAMAFAEVKHNGLRKDGQPEFSHQVSQACLAITLADSLIEIENTFCVIFLHDIYEDKDVSIEELCRLFGDRVGFAVKIMSKTSYNSDLKLPNDVYYENIANDHITSVCKGFDRIHNLMTMKNAFSAKKMKNYIDETNCFVKPMLKSARKQFTNQLNVYENIKFIINNQIELYEIYINSVN